MSQKPLIVGNWKMHGTISESLKRITAITRKTENLTGIDVVLAPPFTALYSVSVALQDVPMKLGAQDVHWETEGAYTGEISATFLKDVGCDYVIVGHSERRTIFQEDDGMINKKLRAALAADLNVVLCIGETAQNRDAGKTFECLEVQLSEALKEFHVHDLEGLNIAYEPVWAIGTGKNASAGQIAEVHDWIRNFMAKQFDAPTANDTRLLYGGSVKKANAGDIFKVHNVDGVLVGGASLDADEFVEIMNAAL